MGNPQIQTQGAVVFIGQDEGNGTRNKWFIGYNYVYPDTFVFHTNGTSYEFLTSNAVSIPTSGWNQVTLVKSGTNYAFYLNGDPIGSVTGNVSIPDPNAPLIFGAAESNFFFNGLMEDVVLYDRALSPAEVDELATATPEPASIWLLPLGVRLRRSPAPPRVEVVAELLYPGPRSNTPVSR